MTDGERWAREVLAELREARYAPRAWGRFLARSFAFAAERRRERPQEHRTTMALGTAGLAAWLVVGLAGRPLLALAGALWWALATLMLDWHLGMLEHPDGTRHDGLGAANVLSFLRAGTPPALFALLASPAGAVLLAAAGASDVVDGWLARRHGETRLGRWLDGSVDGLVLGAAALGALHAGRAPTWLVALVLVRYGLPWLVVATVYFARAAAPDRGGIVSGRIPGLVLFAGLALLALDAPGGTPLTALGASAGLVTLAASVARTLARGRAAAARASGIS